MSDTVSDPPGAGVVVLSGEIDLAVRDEVAEQLRGASTACLAAGHDLVLDASSVSFMDSTGISVVVEASVRMQDGGRALTLIGTTGTIRRVFEIAGLRDLLGD